MLPVYKQSYDLVDNALTPLEEAALAHVLCSPDTSYGDVAGQMFVVQALIPPPQFTLFQQLAAQGATVVKYPRSGRPAKKTFRFSFVEGNIYLTWKVIAIVKKCKICIQKNYFFQLFVKIYILISLAFLQLWYQ